MSLPGLAEVKEMRMWCTLCEDWLTTEHFISPLHKARMYEVDPPPAEPYEPPPLPLPPPPPQHWFSPK